MSDITSAVSPSAESSGSMSPIARAVAVFVRPGSAWAGLDRQAQWFWPMLFTLFVMTAVTAVTYDRVITPMQLAEIDKQVESGALSSEQAARQEEMMQSPMVKTIGIATQPIAMFVVLALIPALLIWLGVGFILGARTGFRKCLEVASWASLVSLPGQLIAFAIGWFRGTIEGVHTGFGALLPDSEVPSKGLKAAGVFLDMIGPLGLWYVAVMVLGAAALSGVATRRVAWVLGAIYLGLAVLMSLVTLAMPA